MSGHPAKQTFILLIHLIFGHGLKKRLLIYMAKHSHKYLKEQKSLQE